MVRSTGIRIRLSVALLGCAFFALAPRASANAPATKTVSLEYQTTPEPTELNIRKARAGVISSTVGVLISTAGIVVGAVLVRVPDDRFSGDERTGVRGAQKKRTAGAVLLVVSPLALGASIYGLVRSRRTRDAGDPVMQEPRKRASWR